MIRDRLSLRELCPVDILEFVVVSGVVDRPEVIYAVLEADSEALTFLGMEQDCIDVLKDSPLSGSEGVRVCPTDEGCHLLLSNSVAQWLTRCNITVC